MTINNYELIKRYNLIDKPIDTEPIYEDSIDSEKRIAYSLI